MSKPDISKPANMLAIQGDRVLVYNHVDASLQLVYVLTVIRVIDVDRQEMRLINREGKTHKPDWLFTQKWYDSLRPARANKEGAKWEVTLKPAK
jgi:hypothetical protein